MVKNHRFRLAGAILVFAAGCSMAAAGMPSIKERYFKNGWTIVPPSAGEDGAPAATPDFPTGPSQDGRVEAQYSKLPHVNITWKAYEMYSAQYEHSELDQYVGHIAAKGDVPLLTERTVMSGAYQEDDPYQNPFNDGLPQVRHFWDCRIGKFAGLFGNDSSVDRAQKYWSGGYGLEGALDLQWDPSWIGQGVEFLYKNNDKPKAYWYLGHIAHLIEDGTVPAHTLLWPHPIPGQDSYEEYMSSHYQQFLNIPEGPIESFDNLYDLFYQTANVTNDFDAGFDSLIRGVDGKKDRGARRSHGFKDGELREEGNVLVPLAIKRVAALFLYFYKQVDKTPPHAELIPKLQPDGKVLLHASAADSQSGVDRYGYRFEFAVRHGNSWSPWASASMHPTGKEMTFGLKPQTRYAFRVWARDAAGNTAVSEVKYLAAPSDLVAAR